MKKIKINEDIIRIIISTVLFIIAISVKNNILNFIILFISYIVIGFEIFKNAIKNIIKGKVFDENFLMVVATISAFCIKEYPEAVMVMLLYEIGEYLADLAVDNTKESITELMDLRVDTVNLKLDDEIKKVDIKKIKLGDIFIVKPGEKIPLDGIIIDGSSTLDTSSLTGESVPRKATKNDKVLSGYVNKNSIITIKSTSTYKTSTAAKIIELIEKSNDKKTKTEKFITKFAKIYTPTVVFLAILIAVIPSILFGNLNEWIYKALNFLVISCPCALVISVPLGFFSGIGRASKEGILIKGSNELDGLADLKNIVLDKTGTITEGVFEVTDINSVGISKNELLEIAAYSEIFSNHPIAKSIVNKYGKKIDQNKVKKYNEISGRGIEARLENNKVLVGNYELMQENKINCDKVENIGTIIYVALNKKYVGYLIISDKIKKEAKRFIKELQQNRGIKVYMLSGDNEEIVNKVANNVNIDKAYSNLLPVDKVKEVSKIKKTGLTSFIGDGINDAPVIKMADIGMAMGEIGSDASIEAADVVIMRDNLMKVIQAIDISKLTRKVVKFNIIFSLIIKVAMLIFAMFGLPIWAAVFADVGVTLIAILNTILIIKRKI